jgi:transposase InsO family protein
VRWRLWPTDLTYILMRRGFAYLVAIVDLATRKVLSHRVSISMTTDFCVEALNEAIDKYGTSDIFNSDQSSQFTSHEFTSVLKENNIQISMDGKGRWVDNVFVERLWRSVKYEHVYLHAYDCVSKRAANWAATTWTSSIAFGHTRRFTANARHGLLRYLLLIAGCLGIRVIHRRVQSCLIEEEHTRPCITLRCGVPT